MQIFFPPRPVMVILFFVLWFIYQLGAALICFRIPVQWFEKDRWLFRTRKWEQGGDVYEKVFHIRRWKGLLPDGGAYFKGGYTKSRLTSFSSENLRLFIAESRRAELTHWLAIFPFWTFGLFAPTFIIWIMLAYALIVNVPCIIAQRYNRPRISVLLARLEKRRPPIEIDSV